VQDNAFLTRRAHVRRLLHYPHRSHNFDNLD
jgi:hypothetical protein